MSRGWRVTCGCGWHSGVRLSSLCVVRGYLSESGIAVSNVAMILEKVQFYYHVLAVTADCLQQYCDTHESTAEDNECGWALSDACFLLICQ